MGNVKSNILDFEDPKTAPLTRIKLTRAQEERLLKIARTERDRYFYDRINPAIDTLTDWGLVTQHQATVKGVLAKPEARLTERGIRMARRLDPVLKRRLAHCSA